MQQFSKEYKFSKLQKKKKGQLEQQNYQVSIWKNDKPNLTKRIKNKINRSWQKSIIPPKYLACQLPYATERIYNYTLIKTNIRA